MGSLGNAASGWPRAILHVDMDAFYVSVYLLTHPEDAGIPLAVGGRPGSRGVVTSASYEARAFGVRSAMPAGQAVGLCPDLKIVGVDFKAVRESSRLVMAILEEYGPLEQISVDEAYVDLSRQQAPVRLSDEIRVRIKSETGLPASVGLATSKLVAKVASDQNKPEGRTIVLPGREAAFMAPLPVRVIWGIGPVTSDRLAELNIETCGELATADLTLLERHFGQHATALRARARGKDTRAVVAHRGPAKSISAERTFERDQRDPDALAKALQSLVSRVGRSLRRDELVAHTVTVKFRWPDFTTFTRQRSVTPGVSADEEILAVAQAIWAENWSPGQPVRLLGVGVGKLAVPAARQLAFEFVSGLPAKS